MAVIYQVKDWLLHFENDRSRSINHCSFVCVPNKQHGMGFCRIVAEPDGAAIYGIWSMILGACSQQSRPRHGFLTSNGEHDGSAWGASDLSMKFRRPIEEIKRALDFLSSEPIGWLVVIDSLTPNSRPTHGELTAHSRHGHLEGRKEGTERTEQKERKKEEGGEHEARPTSACDREWVDALAKSDTYQGIDVIRELGKMQAWCGTNGKQPTRRRFVNWLNRCEKPLQTHGELNHEHNARTGPASVRKGPIDYSKGF